MIKPKNTDRDARKAQKPLPVSAPAPVPPLFRKLDWLALAITFGVVWTVYLLTLAPELTLEDSGELVTGAFYAGIPHPPGYPVWTIYSWLWTALLPIGNMAWRVSVGQAFSGAMACGLLALMVSRGSSMFMEGIEELKEMTGKWESAICLISGVAAGLLLGLDGFMWKESCVVNRIAVTSVPWYLAVLICLLRWIYAPHQLRYAYWAAFLFGLCITLHQSLIVAALGIEVALAAGNPKLGRDVFVGNFIVYLLDYVILALTGDHIFHNLAKPGMMIIFTGVGWGSLAAGIWLAFRTKGLGTYWKPILIMFGLWVLGVSFYLYMAVSGMTNPPMQWGYPRTVEGFFHAISRGQYEQPSPTNLITEPSRFLSQMGMLIEGAADEFTWVYMFIALVPFVFFFKMQKRERAWLIALTAMYIFLGGLLIVLLNPSPDKASADLFKVFMCSSHTIVACLIGYGLALTAAFMATHYQKFRLWGLAGGIVGVVLALFCLWDATGKHYFGPAGAISLSELPHWIGRAFAPNQYGLPIYANLLLVAIALAFVVALVVYRQRGPLFIVLGLFAAMPLYSGLAHWYASDQRNHWFGYWFGHDMFTPPFKGADGKPLYPEMTKDAVLYGGTDPGRFCPTYTIFCESFTPHRCQPLQDQNFDRRDVYIITQNALADGTYLCYIRAHYNRSTQIDPPFFSELLRTALKDKDYQTNLLARAVAPLDRFFEALGAKVEKRRRTYTSWFAENDFTNLVAFAAKLRPGPQQDPLSKYLYENLSPKTQQLLSAQGDQARLRRSLAEDLNVLLERELKIKERLKARQQEKDAVDQEIADGNSSDRLRQKQERLASEIAELSKSGPLYEPERFKQVQLSEYLTDFIKENPQSWTRIRLNRLLLEAAYPNDLVHSLGGVYPDREIYIASPDDSQRCFQEYMADAQRRKQAGLLKPGEVVDFVRDPASGQERVQVSGQVAVMDINGLLTKVMFDHTPKNEFFVEESFPLDWMYPHLTPFGIIMKINRQPLPSLTQDILDRDHQFWKQFSKRLTGDIIDYDTPLKQTTDWIEKTYLRYDFNGFTGDRKFVHDDDAQKSFSKLRSSIGGIYAWRLNPDPHVCPPEYRPKSDAEYQRLLKEADFAFRQAFAFCPYSPEAVFRYCVLLGTLHRFDDALLVAETCLKLDPYNGQVRGLVDTVNTWKKQGAGMVGVEQARVALVQLEDEVRKNPADFQAAFNLAGDYLQMQQTDRAVQVLEGVLNSPQADAPALRGLVTAYSSFGHRVGLQRAADKLEALVSANPENFQAALGLAEADRHLQKPEAAIQVLDKAFNDPKVDASTVLSIAQAYATLGNAVKLEAALERLTKVMPESPEAWYDLAVLKCGLGKVPESLATLRTALDLSAKRLQVDPKARDLLASARKEERFGPMRQMPEFKKLVPP
ncbi:MAG: protein O-mannosyl-transferase family [Limisphaerales bacterium]